MSYFLFSHSLISIVSSLLYYLLFSLLFVLFHNTLSARSSNQLRTTGSFLSLTTMLCVYQFRLSLLFSQIIILPYIVPLMIELFDFINFHLLLQLIIFILLWWLLLLFWWWLLLILLFYVIVLNMQNVAKFGFVTLDITRKNSLYRILNVKVHLDAMDIGIPLNK